MTTTRQGDVVLIHYPTTDLTSTKQRPAVIVSSGRHNRCNLDCVVVPLTSNVDRAPKQSEIYIDGRDQMSSGLPKPSLIKAGVLFTVEQDMIIRSIGSLPGVVLKRTLAAIARLFS